MKTPLLGLLVFLVTTTICNAQMGTITKGKVRSDSIGLMTRLILPETPLKKKPPVLIIAHGSGNKGSWNTYLPMVSRFSDEGLAVVFFDKRGTGESEGNYTEVNAENSREVFEQLARDVAAVAEWTKKQARIDTARIGVLGYSEGGWIAPLAVQKTSVLSFVVILSGPLCSVGQEILFTELTESRSEEEALPQDSILKKMDLLEDGGFDSYPYIEKLEVPGFWLFGEKDKSMAVSFSLSKLKELIKATSTKSLKYRVYENANHSLYDIDSKLRKPYAKDIKDWMLSTLYSK